MNEMRRKRNNDNHGSVMILVLVCMFVVSMIGMMLLSTTLINHKMKTVQSLASENFNDAESVAEEFTLTARQVLMDAYRQAYKELLLNWLKDDVKENRPLYFLQKIAELLHVGIHPNPSLGSDVYTSDGIGDFDSAFALINDKLQAESMGAVSITDRDALVIDVKKQELRLKEVSLSFKDANGYESDIRTDIVFRVALPDDSFATAGTQLNRNHDEYVIVTNADILEDSSGTEGTGETKAFVRGSVYAGNDLRVVAGLEVQGERVVLGNTLKLPYGSELNVLSDGSENNGLWVRNIEIDGGELTLSGNCYVLDDTTFSGQEGGRMELSNGGYYGYSYLDEAEGNPSESSAILINKPNTTLNLAAADTLWLAGNAYIRERALFNRAGAEATMGVLEGESLAYKNLQAVYLLPGCCIVGVGHNPIQMTQLFEKSRGERLKEAYQISEPGKMTQEPMMAVADLTIGGILYPMNSYVPAGTLLPIGTILPAGTTLPCDVSTPIVDMILNTNEEGDFFTEDGFYIDLSLGKAEFGFHPADYVNESEPVTVRFSNTNQQAYYYLRFRNPQKAADYLAALAQSDKGSRLLRQLEALGESQILLPPADRIVTIGNLTRYSYRPDAAPDYGLEYANATKDLQWREALLTSSYNALLSKLTPGGRMDTTVTPLPRERLDMFGHLINITYLFEEDENDTDSEEDRKLVVGRSTDSNGEEIQYCVAYSEDEEMVTTASQIKALLGESNLDNAVVITNGKFVVDSAFGGVIIAKGDVTLKISGVGTALSGGISGLSEIVRNPQIGKYFNAYKPASSEKPKGDFLEMTELIQVGYDGWVKN